MHDLKKIYMCMLEQVGKWITMETRNQQRPFFRAFTFLVTVLSKDNKTKVVLTACLVTNIINSLSVPPVKKVRADG
jgi:hypothetical protein